MTTKEETDETLITNEDEQFDISQYTEIAKKQKTKLRRLLTIILVIIPLIVIIIVLIIILNNKSSPRSHRIYYNVLSHNDYDQSIPLMNALSLYFGWIEADIWLTNISNILYVSHDKEDIILNNTLQSMYLDPLKQRIDHGSLWDDQFTQDPLNLFIDIKSDATKTYKVLHDLIANNYSDIVTSWDSNNQQKYQRYINIVISGNRDFDAVTNEQIRYISLDGRMENLDNPTNITLNYEYMPMISDHFPKIFPLYIANYNNTDPSTWTLIFNDSVRLKQYISICQQQNQYLRFWALPNVTVLMEQISLLDIYKNVYVYNTDHPQQTLKWILENGY